MANTMRSTKLSTRNGGPLAKCALDERKILHKTLLPLIHEEMRQRAQWLESSLIRAAEAEIKLEHLVEILEVANCGSIGGFDKGQPERQSVMSRAAWLLDRGQREFGFMVQD